VPALITELPQCPIAAVQKKRRRFACSSRGYTGPSRDSVRRAERTAPCTVHPPCTMVQYLLRYANAPIESQERHEYVVSLHQRGEHV
jgi:hypothetical protein